MPYLLLLVLGWFPALVGREQSIGVTVDHESRLQQQIQRVSRGRVHHALHHAGVRTALPRRGLWESERDGGRRGDGGA